MDVEKFVTRLKVVVAWRRIYLHKFFMIRFPPEPDEKLQMTTDLACRPEFCTTAFNTATPLPKIALYKSIQKSRLAKLAGLQYNDMDLNGTRVNLTDLSGEVIVCKNNANGFFFCGFRANLPVVIELSQATNTSNIPADISLPGQGRAGDLPDEGTRERLCYPTWALPATKRKVVNVCCSCFSM